MHGCWFRHDDEEDVEEVPLCRDVAASACSFWSRPRTDQGTRLSHSGAPRPDRRRSSAEESRVSSPFFVGVWEEIVEAIQPVPEEQVFQSIGEQIVEGTERVVEQIVPSRGADRGSATDLGA